MANSLKIDALSSLNELSTPDDADLIAIAAEKGGILKKMTWSKFIAAIKSKLGISSKYVLSSVVSVTPDVPSLQPNASSGSISTTFSPPSDATIFIPVMRVHGYNTLTGCSISGNTLTTNYINLSGGVHSGGGVINILCFKKI